MDKAFLEAASINYDEGLRHFAGKEALYERFIKQFSQDDHFQQAKEACEAGDNEGILAGVHALKGVSGTLAMTKLFDACDVLVKYIRSGETADINKLFAEIEKEYDAVSKALEGIE